MRRSNNGVKFAEDVKNVSEMTTPYFVTQKKSTSAPRTNRIIPRQIVRQRMKFMERIFEQLHMLDAQFFFLVDLNGGEMISRDVLRLPMRTGSSYRPLDFKGIISDLIQDLIDFILMEMEESARQVSNMTTTAKRDGTHTTRFMTGRGSGNSSDQVDALKILMIIGDFAAASRVFQIHHSYTLEEPFTDIRIINPFQKMSIRKKGRFTVKENDEQSEMQNTVLDFIKRFYDVVEDVPVNVLTDLRVQYF